LDQMMFLTEASDGEGELFMQFLQVVARQVTHLDVREVMPSPFVPWVEVRGLPRQTLHDYLAL
jgi:hypothetical protein